MPEVSVIIPNFNHSVYLKERIDSVLSQTFQDFEVIILDDCSIDDSREIIEKYRTHEKVAAILYNEINSGSTFRQWNKGVMLSSGRYVWIAESDDIASDRFLEDMLDLYRQYPNVGLAYCQSYRIDEMSNITGDWLQHTNVLDNALWHNRFCIRGIEVIEKYLGFINILPNASAILIKKESYISAGGADEKLILNGDWYLWIKILMKGYAIAYSPVKNNYFREHSMKVTRSAIKKGVNISEAYTILEHITRRSIISRAAKAKLVNYYQTHYLPGIFEKSVTVKAFIQCIKMAFKIAFRPTLKIILSKVLL